MLATRTHVRILRVLALEVVRHLDSIGMLAASHTATHSIFRLADSHPLRPALTFLFEVEAALTP